MANLNGLRIDGFKPYDTGITFSKAKKDFIFINRKKDAEILLIVLAGYKPYLYEDVFSRLRKFSNTNMDICVLSSGLFDKKLDKIASENKWSYLATERNCLPLIQNIAIWLHQNAQFIYKMDEDIFLTKNCLSVLMDTFMTVCQNDTYNIGFVAPLIPINGYGHVRILQKLGLTGVYKKKFENVKYAAVSNRMIGTSPDVAKFFWGDGGFIPSIDYMDEEFHGQNFKYRPCPVNFSIGIILMHRSIWKAMGGWNVPDAGSGMGMDEVQINQFCITYSFAMIISENTVAGHLSFGGQNEAMKEYYATHREVFRCPES